MKDEEQWPGEVAQEFIMGPSKLGPRPMTPEEEREQADVFRLMLEEAADNYMNRTMHYEIPEYQGKGEDVWRLTTACGTTTTHSPLKLTTNPKRITCRRCVDALTRKR